jgi:hypothetical protein
MFNGSVDILAYLALICRMSCARWRKEVSQISYRGPGIVGRPEVNFPDHKQRLGTEEYQAWTTEPVLRTFQVQMVALILLRLLQCRLNQNSRMWSWLSKPEWYMQKRHGSARDLCHFCWRHCEVFSQLLVALEAQKKNPVRPRLYKGVLSIERPEILETTG